ncbi:MAG: D-alanyl-D-alanine carboxypeptidase family protein [Bacillota bacterium]|nr:D-alanyl-D-alanine carboxypeptidase family protein [Bacillota bacterium]
MRLIRIFVCFVLCLCMIIMIYVPNVCALSEKETTSPSEVLIEATTGKVLYDKNSHEVRACASITKVMTLLLVFEALDSGKIHLTDEVTASAHASSMGGSDIWLAPGEKMTVDDMIKATVVASANDAAVALAEYIDGSEDGFVAAMNNKAKKLGMKETVFKNCNGLDEDGHVTSAYDVAVMSKELIKHKGIFKYSTIWMDTLRGGKTQIVNTNKLLKSYNGITGLKTGTTGKAGSCISATATRNGMNLIAVVLGSKTGTERFKDAATLLDYGFANFAVSQPQLPQGSLHPIKVTNGMQTEVNTDCKIGSGFLVSKGEDKDIKCKVEYNDSVTAPVKNGQKVGTVKYILKNDTLAEYPIVTVGSIKPISFGCVFKLMMQYLFSL